MLTLFLASLFAWHAPQKADDWPHPAQATTIAVKLRKFPYPYEAMAAIASDADGLTLRKFNMIHRLLNTRDHTPWGPGLGLDVADSFFFYVGTDKPGPCDADGTPWQDQMSYFRRLSTQETRHATEIAYYTRVGWIDSLHSMGDFSMQDQKYFRFRRDLAATAARELRVNHLRYSVWINHGNVANAQNFGDPRSSYQQGDKPRSPCYLTDLMLPLGVKFVWVWRSSTPGLPSMLHPIRLRDGRKVWGFYRYTDDGDDGKGGVRWNWNPRFLDRQLSPHNLRLLEEKHWFTIYSQHLGAYAELYPFVPRDVLALRRLAREYHLGRILVTRTSRLLQFNEVEQFLQYSTREEDGRIQIRIGLIKDPVLGWRRTTVDELRGITFYTPDPCQTTLWLGRERIPLSQLRCNPPDRTGSPSLGVRWWPEDTTDYSLDAPVANTLRYQLTLTPFPHWRVSRREWDWTETAV